MREIERQLQGYRLTTAEITYRLPDHPDLLQTYIWQQLDLAPEYPKLKKFLAFWEEEIEGPIHSVTVGSRQIIAAPRFRHVRASLVLH